MLEILERMESSIHHVLGVEFPGSAAKRSQYTHVFASYQRCSKVGGIPRDVRRHLLVHHLLDTNQAGAAFLAAG